METRNHRKPKRTIANMNRSSSPKFTKEEMKMLKFLLNTSKPRTVKKSKGKELKAKKVSPHAKRSKKSTKIPNMVYF